MTRDGSERSHALEAIAFAMFMMTVHESFLWLPYITTILSNVRCFHVGRSPSWEIIYNQDQDDCVITEKSLIVIAFEFSPILLISALHRKIANLKVIFRLLDQRLHFAAQTRLTVSQICSLFSVKLELRRERIELGGLSCPFKAHKILQKPLPIHFYVGCLQGRNLKQRIGTSFHPTFAIYCPRRISGEAQKASRSTNGRQESSSITRYSYALQSTRTALQVLFGHEPVLHVLQSQELAVVLYLSAESSSISDPPVY
jgi:hypothetical protein